MLGARVALASRRRGPQTLERHYKVQFALVTLGLIMIVSGARDTYAALGKEVAEDVTDFMPWIIAIGGIGMLGYFDKLKPFSRGFMALIFIVMVIRNGGFFDKLNEAMSLGPVRPGDTAKDITPAQSQNAVTDVIGKMNAGFDPSKFSSNSDPKENFKTTVDVLKMFFI
jgi:hypothetical protein